MRWPVALPHHPALNALAGIVAATVRALPGDDGRGGAAAVHVQHDSVDERGLVAGEVDRGVRDGLRVYDTAGRGAVHPYRTAVHLARRKGHRHTGGDRVYPHALRAELRGPGPRQCFDGAL